MTQAQFLSTGQAASLLGVTPDTVLKWIKKGKLPSTRTAGGHFRVAREEILALVGGDEAPTPDESKQGEPSFCWEFHALEGRVNPACHECLVYRSRALRCYELSHLSGELGHAGVYCATSCDDCSYYLREVGRPRRVMVVTDSVHLRQRLATEADSSGFKLEFASGEYECSASVESFKPEFVVIDCSPGVGISENLSSHLGSDPRIPDVRIIVVGSPSSAEAASGAVFARVPRPFSLNQLDELLDAGQQAVLETAKATSGTETAAGC